MPLMLVANAGALNSNDNEAMKVKSCIKLRISGVLPPQYRADGCPNPADEITLGDTAGYARPTDDFGPAEAAGAPLENLIKLRQMLIDKRRYLAQDAMTYPVVYLGRAQDIADVQGLLRALNEAIDHERMIQDFAEQAVLKERHGS